jgi:hypothetical protein
MGVHDDSWDKFFNPETLRDNLLSISLYISAFELFKEQVVDKPKVFFSDGFTQDGPILGETYEKQVLSLSKSKVKASLLWFREMGALNDVDVAKFDELRKYRNRLVHEMAEFIGSSTQNIDSGCFDELTSLFFKLEKWWFKEFEMALQSEALPEGSDPDDVIPGQIWFIRLMRDIALGLEPSEGYYYGEYQKFKT